MSVTKDPMRPLSQHRLSVGSSGPNFPNSGTSLNSRQHSHSTSLSSFGTAYRISRRKSSFSAASINKAALAAAAAAAAATAREVNNSRPVSQGDGLSVADLASSAGLAGEVKKSSTSAIVDGPPLGQSKSASRARSRRASEGSRLIKERRNTGTASELKSCDTCGKSYKHGSCLQKHLWEHTPEWALTSKLLISKHAQVQLLEAASVLVGMTQDRPDSSDTSSQSPIASGSSAAIDDEDSSSRTSTPSQDHERDHYDDYPAKSSAYRQRRRQDSYSSLFSRSYQSTAASSVPNDIFSSRQHWLHSSRPSTATGMAQNYADEQADIAAAAEGLVSCSIGTPQYRPTSMHLADVPPVPPLPAKFAALQASPFLAPQSESSGDVDMSDDERRYRARSARVDEDEEGVFGRME